VKNNISLYKNCC
jgi:hypothetical protein